MARLTRLKGAQEADTPSLTATLLNTFSAKWVPAYTIVSTSLCWRHTQTADCILRSIQGLPTAHFIPRIHTQSVGDEKSEP
jgi:hypothetical protein